MLLSCVPSGWQSWLMPGLQHLLAEWFCFLSHGGPHCHIQGPLRADTLDKLRVPVFPLRRGKRKHWVSSRTWARVQRKPRLSPLGTSCLRGERHPHLAQDQM